MADRRQPDGSLLVEGERTNHLLWSVDPQTQTVLLRAGIYTLWIEAKRVASWTTVRGLWPEPKVDFLTLRTWTERLFSLPWCPWRRYRRSASSDRPMRFGLPFDLLVEVSVRGPVQRFQCEEGWFPSSYIATAAEPVTRKADQLQSMWSPTANCVGGVHACRYINPHPTLCVCMWCDKELGNVHAAS